MKKNLETINIQFLEFAYSFFDKATTSRYNSLLVKAKIIIGLTLLASKSAYAQKVISFPNQKGKIDSLELNANMEEDDNILCYEVVVIGYGKDNGTVLYKGGDSAMYEFIRKHISYPKEALTAGIEDNVSIHLQISKKGEIVNARIIQKVGNGFDEEALRVVGKLRKFIPAKDKNGAPIESNKTIIIRFEIPEK